ncbi:MAG: C39 family peptidase [Lachnospiraceae bacterium]|nr:C39 family peptidase [Lachnospiraceae bacterium]
MEKHSKEEKKDGILPVFFGIFLVATVAVLLILTATLLSRNGTFAAWKAQYTEWKEAKEAAKRAETAGEKTVHYFGPSGVAEYESWFSGMWKSALLEEVTDEEGNKEEQTEKDPLREALTASPVNGSESWWSEATKLSGDVTLYAQGDTPLFGAPRKDADVCGYAAAGEEFRLLAVFEDGWYVVSDERFYYCSHGSRYTLVPLENVKQEALAVSLERQKVFHEVDTLLQNPELPHGCEVTGLAILLSYYDIPADKCELADEWIPKGAWGETDFRKAFVGNPRKSYASAGCFATVIADTANRYLEDWEKQKSERKEEERKGKQNTDSELVAVAKEGVSFEELLSMVEEAPVLAWTTMNLQAPYIAQVWEVDGEELYWQNLEHCVVLTGYDSEKGIFYGTDPLYGPCEYDMKLFSIRFQTMYSQVVQLVETAP